jgi:predicted HAD superfamily Cof-like phosphohydrolase
MTWDPLADIEEFHIKFGIAYDGPPRLLPKELEQFRIKFLAEELVEYITGDASADKLDALVDLAYVLLGTAHLHGYNFREAWRRVHEANMKKVRVERASDSKRGSAFDVIKPPGWTAPDHSDLT